MEISEVLVPFVLNVAFDPAGALVADQVYVRFPVPPMSVASTLKSEVVPVTGLGVADAGSVIAGGVSTTVTFAVPLTVPLVALTVAEPGVFPAE